MKTQKIKILAMKNSLGSITNLSIKMLQHSNQSHSSIVGTLNTILPKNVYLHARFVLFDAAKTLKKIRVRRNAHLNAHL